MLRSDDHARRRLFDALSAHVPLDAVEARHREAILRLVETASRPFDRRTYTPGHVTGSAFVACRATGHVLLHRHRRLGKWLQMGGHDEGARDAAATALREAREESGLSDLAFLSAEILDLDVHEIPPARGEPAHLHHDVRYALVTARPEEIRRDEAESDDLAWLSLDEAEARMAEPGASRALGRLRLLLTGSSR